MVLVALNLAIRKFWYKYHCFSLHKADTINTAILWVLLPFSLVTYYYSKMCSMYISPLTFNAILDHQWYVYFTSQQFYILLLSIVVFLCFKSTRNAGIATAVLVKGIYNTIGETFGLADKYASYEIIWQLLLFVLMIHALKQYRDNARKNTAI